MTEPARQSRSTAASYHLRVEADLGRLSEVRRFVREQVSAAAAPAECLDDVVQAVGEAATNVINHGYRGSDGWLEIGVAFADGHCVVTLEDVAPTFDPTAVPEPAIEPLDRRPGGMGIHLIRESTDGFTYRPRPGGGNILTLVRSLEAGRSKEG